MFSEKLFSLLNSLSKVELNRFRRFLSSTYLNEQPDLLRLFDWCDAALRKNQADFENADRNRIWLDLFPNKKYDDTALRRLTSDLIQMGLRFKAMEAKNQNPLNELLGLQPILDSPQLEKLLNGVERQIQKTLDSQRGQSADFYLHSFRFRQNVFNRTSKSDASDEFIENLILADRELDCFFIIQKLQFYLTWLVFRGFRSTDKEIPIIEGMWKYIEKSGFDSIPIIKIYRQAILCYAEPTEEWHYRGLIGNLELHGKDLGKPYLKECYFFAQNYCAFKINQGKTEYYREVFHIYKNIIEQNLLVEDGQLSERVYKNIITSSLGVGEFDWAEKFILEYSNYIPSPIRENAKRYNLAYLYFHRKQFDLVIETLRDVGYSDLIYSLGTKVILLSTYYEKRELLPLDSLMESFRIFLRRNQVISKELKKEYMNFLNFLKKLVGASSASAIRLRKEIQENRAVTSKKWLLEKTHELEHK